MNDDEEMDFDEEDSQNVSGDYGKSDGEDSENNDEDKDDLLDPER